jgi:hypothetical protein
MREWDEAVLAVLDRAERLTHAEAVALDAALRERPDVEPLAWKVLWDIEREGYFWNTFPDWETPFAQWSDAKRRVGIALGGVEVDHPDDGSVAWGAATAAACAVLGSWAPGAPALREPWERVVVP